MTTNINAYGCLTARCIKQAEIVGGYTTPGIGNAPLSFTVRDSTDIATYDANVDKVSTTFTYGTDASGVNRPTISVTGSGGATGARVKACGFSTEPSDTLDCLATKEYVDSRTDVLFPHGAVKVVVFGALTGGTYDGDKILTCTVDGGIITGSVPGVSVTIQGITININDRVLINDQENGGQGGSGSPANGVYDLTSVGATITFTRSSDLDTPLEIHQGTLVRCEVGSYAGLAWFLTTDPTDLAISPQKYVEYSLGLTPTGILGEIFIGQGGSNSSIYSNTIGSTLSTFTANGESVALTAATTSATVTGVTTTNIVAQTGILTLDAEASTAILDGHAGVDVIASNSGDATITSVAGKVELRGHTDVDATTTVGSVNIQGQTNVGVTAVNGHVNVSSSVGEVNINSNADSDYTSSGSIFIQPQNQLMLQSVNQTTLQSNTATVQVVSLASTVEVVANNDVGIYAETGNIITAPTPTGIVEVLNKATVPSYTDLIDKGTLLVPTDNITGDANINNQGGIMFHSNAAVGTSAAGDGDYAIYPRTIAGSREFVVWAGDSNPANAGRIIAIFAP